MKPIKALLGRGFFQKAYNILRKKNLYYKVLITTPKTLSPDIHKLKSHLTTVTKKLFT
jgi:hypothetical protein